MSDRHGNRLAGAAAAVGLALAVTAGGAPGALAQDVSVTPLGSHDGEFCPLDRAMIFEDPDGTRILYDAGRTVAGPDDSRLGAIDAVLLTHVHADHLGDRHIGAVKQGPCTDLAFPVSATPNSNTVDIMLAKDAVLVIGSEMNGFFARKVEQLGGDPAKVQLVRFGASRKVGGVTITTVPAVHSNGLGGAFIEGEIGGLLNAAGLSAYVGAPTGYVLSFTNGLVVYLSGDTGVTAEQETVVEEQYGAELAVINIGDTFTTGPTEAAWAIDELVEPNAVIPSHANEPATEGGRVKDGTRTAAFLDAVEVPAHLPLSGRTMTFDGDGECTSGC